MSRVEERDNLFTRTQNLTRTLRAIDHGKVLKCVGSHPAYPEGYSAAEALLIVQCKKKPKPTKKTNFLPPQNFRSTTTTPQPHR